MRIVVCFGVIFLVYEHFSFRWGIQKMRDFVRLLADYIFDAYLFIVLGQKISDLAWNFQLSGLTIELVFTENVEVGILPNELKNLEIPNRKLK